MKKTVRVVVGGKEFNLRGENEVLIKQAAAEVNNVLDILSSKYLDQPIPTLTTLAALNIAEKYCNNLKQKEIDSKYINEELNAMARYIQTSMSKEN